MNYKDQDGKVHVIPSADFEALLPPGCVAITDAEAAALLAPPPPTVEDLANNARAKRDGMLSVCDWVVTKAIESGSAVPSEWKIYRQALRDVTLQPGFPEAIDWPVSP